MAFVTSKAGAKMKGAAKVLIVLAVALGAGFLDLQIAFWWANIPPKRPADVPANATFLWAGALGLPAPKHGTWIQCWTDRVLEVNRCKLTEMDGRVSYMGVFLVDTGKNPVPASDLKIESEPTSDVTNWVSLGGLKGAPLVFLKNGTVLLPKDAYQEGLTKLQQLRKDQGR